MARRKWHWDPDRKEFLGGDVGHPPCWRGDQSTHGCDGGCCSEDFPGRVPRAGDLALCGAGYLGLITSPEKVVVVYKDKNKAEAWTGVHLTTAHPGKKVGALWSSRNPVILGRAEDILPGESLRDFVIRTTPQPWPAADDENWV